MAGYEDVMRAAAPVFERLHQIILENREPYIAEGSIWFLGGGDISKTHHFEHKRRNLFQLAARAKDIMEVGFNAGHSTAIMLLANPNSKITVFDLGEHPYTVPALEYLGEVFPGRIRAAYLGDSRETLPRFVKDEPEARFDLLHIDGGHTEEVLSSDFEWCSRIAKPGMHRVVIDDDDYPVIHKFNRRMVAEGRLRGPFVEGLHGVEGAGDARMYHFVGEYIYPAKPEVELVICRWQRDLAWLAGVPREGRSIYIHDKGGAALQGLSGGDRVVQIPNLGVDQYSHLRYIVDNYDNLPDVVIFCQDDMDGHTDSYKGITFRDTEHMISHMIAEVRENGHTLNAYTWAETFGKGILPAKDLKFMKGSELVETNIPETFGEWFCKYVVPGWERWEGMLWFKNAIFGASREQIRKRPKYQYEAILQQFRLPRSELDHFVERVWYYLLCCELQLLYIAGKST